MKRVWLNLLLLCAAASLSAQSYQRIDRYEEDLYGKRLHVSGSFTQLQQVRDYWSREYTRLKGYEQYDITLCGNGESVLRISIPVSELFQPNDSVLSIQSEGVLRPFLRLLRGDGAKATVLVACHSDNNGSPCYLEHITTRRAKAICTWMRRQGVESRSARAYGVGNHVSLNDNRTLSDREANRRVTFYLVPNRHMLKLAKRRKLV